MKKVLLVLSALVFAVLPAWGQGAQRRDRVQAVDGRAMGGQTVSVCAYSSGSYSSGVYTGPIPCTPGAPLFKDVLLSVPITLPLLTDSQGNFFYWVSPGNYTECVTGPNVTGSCYAVMAPCNNGSTISGCAAGASLLPLNNIWTGNTNNFMNSLLIQGNIVPAFFGTGVIGDCVGIKSLSPLLLNDVGGCAGGGGSGNVIASNQYEVFNQPNSGSSATAQGLSGVYGDSTGNNLTVTNLLTAGSDSIDGNQTTQGPRPRIDVTAFGAKGDNSTDDTTAITNAINFVCSSGNGGTVTFPTGGVGAAYVVTQAQGGSGSTAATFTSCSGLSFEGTGSGGYTLQFASSPSAKIVVRAGANPSAGPLFLLPNAAGNSVSFTNLVLSCQNQCINNQGSYVQLNNLGLAVTNMGATYADNVTLVEKGFWTKWIKGVVNGGILLPVDNSGNGAYDFTLRDVQFNQGNFGSIGSQNLTGYPIIADIRQNFASYAGVWDFYNDTTENVNSSFVGLENSTGNACTSALPAGFKDITFNHVLYADGAANTAVLQDFTGCGINGVRVDFSVTSNGGGGVAVRMSNGGPLTGVTVSGPTGYSLGVVDVNGNPVSGAIIQQNSGIDSYVPTKSIYNGYRTDLSLANMTTGLRSDASGPAVTASGNLFRSLQLDPTYGVMFSPGNAYGYTSSLAQTIAGDMDLYFANLMPPTSASGTPTTGGTLSNGSYWYAIRAALTTNCSAATQSAPTVIGPVVLSGGNNAVSISLSQPVGLTPVGNYCIQRFTSAPSNGTLQSTSNGQISSGSSATTFTDTGTTGGGNTSTAIMSNQMGPALRFTPTEMYPINTGVYSLGDSSHVFSGLFANAMTIAGCAGQYVKADGTGCGNPPGTGAGTIAFPVTVTGGTTGYYTSFGSSTQLVRNTNLDDGATTANTLTYAGASGITAAQFKGTGFSGSTLCLHSVSGVITQTSGDCSTGGTVTNVGTVAPLSGTVTTTGNLSCPTCVTASSPGAGIAHFAGSTQAVTSSAVNLASSDVTGLTPIANGGTGTSSPALVAGTNVTITGSWPNQTINSSGGGGGSVGPGTTNGIAYFNASSTVTSPTPPSVNGQYVLGYSVAGGTSVPPTATLVGLTGGTIAGGSTSYITATADNSTVITHLVGGTASATLTLSTPATVLNANPVYSYSNHSSHTDTIAPAGGYTIQSGSSAAASTLSVISAVECRLIVDPTPATTNWLADCRPNSGAGSLSFASVTPGTNTGALLMGTGGSLGLTGTGTINANILNGVTLTGAATTGNCIVATSSSAADWGSCAGLSLPATVGGTVTSGGILGFTSTTTAASSALLALGHVMLGGGAGATPTTDANLDDGQTLLNQLTYAGTAGIKASQGALVAGLNGGVSEPFVLQEGTAPPSSGAQDRCYGDSTFHWLLCSMNNGSYNQVVVSSSSSSTSGDLVTYSGSGGNTVQDSNITGANVVLAAAPAASAKQVCTATANSSKTCSYIDFPEVFEFPTANVNGSNAGNGWSINTTCGALPAIYARTGTNLATGYLQFSASESACTQFELPADWDTATNPYIRVNYTQNGSTSSQSIIYTIQVGCSTTTDDAAYATAQTFSTTTTGATANTPYTQTLQLNSTSMTACAGGSMMNLKVSTAAGSSAATNLQMVSLTVPRLITVQAN